MTADEWVDPVPFARPAPAPVDDDVRAAAAEIHDGGRFCDRCEGWRELVDEFDDQLGVEEQAREVRVTALDCGHEQVVPIRRRWPWSP